MPISDAASKASGMLSDLKSRLGFSQDEQNYDDDYIDDEYDDYDDGYDDYDDRYDDGYSRDNERSSESRSSRFSSRSSGYQTRAPRYAYSESTPNLVSIDDVKARTQMGDSISSVTSEASENPRMTRRNGRNFVESGGPAASSPAYNAAVRQRERVNETRSRSEGLNSLFEPASGTRSYDPYEAYSGSGSASFSATRGLTVVKPVIYSDVERVARAVKAGDVVVLALRNTPDDLSKRVLDFAFGVASALDANVECPGSKVFAIARGRGLSDDEKANLRGQGVL